MQTVAISTPRRFGYQTLLIIHGYATTLFLRSGNKQDFWERFRALVKNQRILRCGEGEDNKRYIFPATERCSVYKLYHQLMHELKPR